MKRTIVLACSTLILIGGFSLAHAELKVIGEGAAMKADITNFPPPMKAIYPLFEKKCAKCHGMDRTLTTIQTGMAPSGAPFDNAAVDAYAAKMLRKPDSDMTKPEVKTIMELLRYMLDEAAK